MRNILKKPEEKNKFIEVIKRIKPQIALLAFEKYADDANDAEKAKQFLQEMKREIEKLNLCIKVEILIASERDKEFDLYTVCLYPIGERTKQVIYE